MRRQRLASCCAQCGHLSPRERSCAARCALLVESCVECFLPRAARLEIAGRLLFMEENPAHALLRVFDERTGRLFLGFACLLILLVSYCASCVRLVQESYGGSPTRVTAGTASREGSGPGLGAPSGSTAANRCALSHAARAATMQPVCTK